MPTVYKFEAKSIQHYILDSGKLKDMIGASEQIEYLCSDNGLLDQVLCSMGLYTKVQFARKAGGAFVAIFSEYQDDAKSQDNAKRFQAVWTFCVQHAFPGLAFVQGMGTDDSLKVAIKQMENAFKIDDHNRLPLTLPLAGPLVTRNPRTGQPAVVYNLLKERLDAVTNSKRKLQFRKGKLLTDKLALKHENKQVYDWPVNLNDKDQEDSDEKIFPLLPDNRYIGIIHADGNNFGQLLKAVQNKLLENPNHYATVMKAFSEAVRNTSIESAQQATIRILAKWAKKFVIPARPLVLGGDDLTFIVRGDLALDFTKMFLEEFEERSQDVLTKLKQEHNGLKEVLPQQLTACAGIAYIKASQPFYQGYKLAASLCEHAKKFSHTHQDDNNLMPSSLAFHRITTSIISDYNSILEKELTTAIGIKITMQPYLVGHIEARNSDECLCLNDLQDLSDFLAKNEVSHGTMREFLSLLEIDYQQAVQSIQRWYDNMEKRQQTDLLDRFKQVLKNLIKQPDLKMNCPLKLINARKELKRTPIGDALALIHISKGSDYVSD